MLKHVARIALAAAVAMAQPQTSAPGTPLRRPTSTLVWKGDPVDTQGSVSPDGRYISFVDWETGDLAMYDSETDKHRMVVAANNPARGQWKAYAGTSAISRDGSKVAYSWFDISKGRSALWIANLHGDPMPHRLYEDPQVEWIAPRDWAPDSRWIAVFVQLKDRSNQLVLVPLDEKTPRVLKAGRWPGTARAFFSPDGKHLAYDLPQGVTTLGMYGSRRLMGRKTMPQSHIAAMIP